MNDDPIRLLVHAINTELPQPIIQWPGGWPDEIEAALIDAVLSIRAQYGQSHNGVRGAIRRYRNESHSPLNSMDRLARYTDEELQSVLGVTQKTSSRSKTGAIIEAAQSLKDVGVEQAAHVEPVLHKSAYTRVHGLGGVTWEYFTMLLGKPGVKADRWIIAWVSYVLRRSERPVTSHEAGDLLRGAHSRLIDTDGRNAPSLTQLDHAIWSHARKSL